MAWYAYKMRIPLEPIAVMLALERLAEIFDIPELTEDVRREVPINDGGYLDAVVTIRGHSFALEWKRSGSLSHVAAAIHQLEMIQSKLPLEMIPLLAVPYMTTEGQEACAQAGLPWLDLSGNARIVVPGFFYQNRGNPNRFRRPGPPESAFGPRGSRIARHLLMDPSRAVRQRDLASGTGLNEGHTSRIVAKLLETGLVERGEDGISVVDADALLDAWLWDYRFDRHHVIRGHVSAGGGDALIHSLAEALSKKEESYAATALPAAWLWTRFAPFQLVTVYISTLPSPGLKKDLGFREEATGANTWLVIPNDEGVFHGAEPVDGIPCVHPVQAIVDLKDHPEESTDAAAELRRRLLWGGKNDI